MTELHKDFPELEILALPSMQFGGQELATDAEVADFAAANGPFPPGTVLGKGDVNGDTARPTYQYVRAATGMADCSWNFKCERYAFPPAHRAGPCTNVRRTAR